MLAEATGHALVVESRAVAEVREAADAAPHEKAAERCEVRRMAEQAVDEDDGDGVSAPVH
jgi:hypothetical protein